MVEGLAAAGHVAAVITGDTSDEDRQRAQDDIQARRKRVFVGSMRACGIPSSTEMCGRFNASSIDLPRLSAVSELSCRRTTAEVASRSLRARNWK